MSAQQVSFFYLTWKKNPKNQLHLTTNIWKKIINNLRFASIVFKLTAFASENFLCVSLVSFLESNNSFACSLLKEINTQLPMTIIDWVTIKWCSILMLNVISSKTNTLALVNKLVPRCTWLLSGALEITMTIMIMITIYEWSSSNGLTSSDEAPSPHLHTASGSVLLQWPSDSSFHATTAM